MAVYMYDEYAAAYPEQQLTLFNKFLNYEKNLHEMSVPEINAILAECDGFTEGTVNKMKASFRHYLKFIASHGVKFDISLVNEVSFPMKQVHYYIFSTDDIRHYWNLVIDDMAEIASKRKRRFFRELFYKDIAVGILAFYGFTVQQIKDLSRWDITEDGIKGFNIEFTESDLADLIRYRDLKLMPGNNSYLLGDKFIRSSKSAPDDVISDVTITRFAAYFRKADVVSEQYKFLKSVLTYDNLYKLGVFNRIYKIEKENNYSMAIKGSTPQWFIEAANNDTSYTKYNYKRDYVMYRTERDTTQFIKENIKTQQDTSSANTPRQSAPAFQIRETMFNSLERELTAITSEMAQLSQRLEAVRQMIITLKE